MDSSKTTQDVSCDRPRTIALLEDDPDFGPLLKDMLEGEGFIVSLHSNAISALAFIDNNHVDLVITDMFIKEDGLLAEQGGLSLISKIKQIIGHPAPIIAISGSFSQDEVKPSPISAAKGADYMMAKPLDHKTLMNVIRELLGNSAKH